MKNQWIITRSDHYKTSKWQGGKTTELFIYPPDGDYQKRDFQIRLSTATVEAEKSDFTTLAGFHRKLMILSGKITIVHEDHYSRQLGKFQVDDFDGAWKTSSVGTCTDFNLMTRGKPRCELKATHIEKDKHISCQIHHKYDWLFIYLHKGMAEIKDDNTHISLNNNELLTINKAGFHTFEIFGTEESELIFAWVDFSAVNT